MLKKALKVLGIVLLLLIVAAAGFYLWRSKAKSRLAKVYKAKDGHALREPMSVMMAYAKRMTDIELRAMWTYLRSVPKRP